MKITPQKTWDRIVDKLGKEGKGYQDKRKDWIRVKLTFVTEETVKILEDLGLEEGVDWKREVWEYRRFNFRSEIPCIILHVEKSPNSIHVEKSESPSDLYS